MPQSQTKRGLKNYECKKIKHKKEQLCHKTITILKRRRRTCEQESQEPHLDRADRLFLLALPKKLHQESQEHWNRCLSLERTIRNSAYCIWYHCVSFLKLRITFLII